MEEARDSISDHPVRLQVSVFLLLLQRRGPDISSSPWPKLRDGGGLPGRQAQQAAGLLGGGVPPHERPHQRSVPRALHAILQQQGQLRGEKVSRGEEGGVTGVRAALVTYSTSHLDRIGCPPPCSLFLSFPFALGRPAPAITTVLQTRPRVAFRCETLKFFQKQKGGSKARARPARARRERASEKSMTTSSRRGTGRTTSNGRVAA